MSVAQEAAETAAIPTGVYGPMTIEEEAATYEQGLKQRAAGAVAAGVGGFGIGTIILLVVAGIFLLSHTGRRR